MKISLTIVATLLAAWAFYVFAPGLPSPGALFVYAFLSIVSCAGILCGGYLLELPRSRRC